MHVFTPEELLTMLDEPTFPSSPEVVFNFVDPPSVRHIAIIVLV
jgi:hypothetical protein